MNRLILLDTCAALWVMDESKMRQPAMDAIDLASSRDEKIYVSPITAWEIGMLAAKGRFKSNYTPQRWLQLLLSQPGIVLSEMPARMLLESWYLPASQLRDPWDRIIAATAREYGYTVITRDRALLDYAQQGHLSAVEC